MGFFMTAAICPVNEYPLGGLDDSIMLFRKTLCGESARSGFGDPGGGETMVFYDCGYLSRQRISLGRIGFVISDFTFSTLPVCDYLATVRVSTGGESERNGNRDVGLGRGTWYSISYALDVILKSKSLEIPNK